MDDFCLVDQVSSTIREWIFFFLRKKRQVYMGLEFEGTVINGKEVLTTGGVLGNCCRYINSQETERDEWQGCLSFPFYLIL